MLEKLKEGAKKFGVAALDNIKAGADMAGAVGKTVVKRATGDNSPTVLKSETKKTLGIK